MNDDSSFQPLFFRRRGACGVIIAQLSATRTCHKYLTRGLRTHSYGMGGVGLKLQGLDQQYSSLASSLLQRLLLCCDDVYNCISVELHLRDGRTHRPSVRLLDGV